MVLAKKPPLIVTIGTALLLIGGGAMVYWAIQWRSANARGLPPGVKAVPESAAAVVSLSTDAEQWQRLRQFGTPETQASFDQQLANWRDRWLATYDISFAQDIEPWVGPEVTLAWLPNGDADATAPSSDAPLGSQRQILLLPIADPEAAQITAESLPVATAATNQVEYRGVALTAYDATGDSSAEASAEPIWMGVLGTQLVLVAETEAVAKQAIDAFKGGKSLADLPGYRRSFEHIGTPQAFSRLYFSVPAIVQMLAQTSQPPLAAPIVASFQESRGLAATVNITSQGIQVKSTSWLGPSSDRTYVDTNIPAQLPQYLPRDTLIMASGGNFQQFWEDLSAERNWGALTALSPDNLALALQSRTGLTLESDLLPWMAGEFAIALVPSQDTPEDDEEASLPNPGLVTLLQVSDRTKSEQTFSQLDTVVKDRHRFSILKEPAGRTELIKWVSPFQSVALSRGWLDNNIALFTVGNETEDAIVPKPRRPLTTAPLFQLTTADAPTVNSGYFFVNLEALNQNEDNLFLPTLSVDNQGVLRAIQALGVTATVIDDQRLRYDLYIALERGNRPGPLPNGSTADPSGETSTEETSPAEAIPEAEVAPTEDPSNAPEAAGDSPAAESEPAADSDNVEANE
ncbi:MAG: DUF3352 domain-containing protein [Leptolyngbyaceae cyanobacterium]